jgi:hypothetical protein
VAKLWPFLSVLLVVVMLLFLAPTFLLLPAQIVSAADEAVVQEVTANFTFNETTNGDWWTFQAGNNTVQGTPPRLCLEQYTRDNVVIPGATANLSGCEFRNYTTGSGSVSGDLSGSLSLAWITSNFNMTYSHTPIYMTATHFGWMMGRGHIDEGGGNNFTVVLVADFDSDTATMSNAVGKGFMLSANETGTFAGHKIIGDFNITKTGTSYSGTFHLRNYAPNEVVDLYSLNVSGYVMQEFTDAIHTPLALVNYNTDGPYVTPLNITTDFEEIDWGKDPIKTVTSGHLGINGTMDLSRNTALYLELGGPWVRIQGTTACNLLINDTYAVTGNDGSTYGKLYELLLLYIPDQQLTIGDFFFQNGYTFTPFGMLNPSTDCYAGAESFALAGVAIQSAVGNAMQWSVDHSYGLYPHPKVTSVTPASASPGATINVTIKGKYFLRADNFVPNSGSVSFGPNITVNSYTIKNSSAIDNEITANITIAGGAAIGARNVSVTSCFGYSNGNGTTPYKTGTLVDGFSVVAAGSGVEGHVTFSGRGTAGTDKWIETFVVKGFSPGTSTLLWTNNATTNNTGVFTVTGLTPGTYDISIKNWTCLDEKVLGVVLNSTAVVDFGTPREGDSNNDDYITGADRSILYTDWGKTVPPGTWHADFNRDGWLTGSDRSYMYTFWGQKGDSIP